MLKPYLFAPLWTRRPSTLLHATGPRTEVPPPALLDIAPAPTLWQRAMAWLLAPAPQEQASMQDQLARVRDDFLAALDDIRSAPADALRQRIVAGRALRELWHARSAIFSIVALVHSQAEAERRLNALNRHFPSRAARPQFAPS